MEEDDGPEPDSISRPNRSDILLISALVITAFILRMLFISSESFWIDEIMTSLRSQWGTHEMLRSIAERDHLPLYYLTIQIWAGFFGSGEAGLRSFSALMGAISVIPIYLIGRRFSRRRALMIGAVACVLPVMIYFGQEAKMYSLLILLSSLSIYLLMEYLDPIHLRWSASRPLLIIVNLLLAFTHYYSYLLLIGELALISFVIIKRDQGFRFKNMIKIAVPVIVPILSFSVWLTFIIFEGVLFDQTTGGGISFAPLSLLAIIPFLSGSYGVPETIKDLPMVSASIFLLISVIITFFPGKGIMRTGICPKHLAVFLLLLVPGLSIIISLSIMNIFGYRYFLILIPVVMCLAIWPVERVKVQRTKDVLLILTVAFSIIALPVQYNETDKFDWRGAVSYIEDSAEEGDIVVPVPHWERRSVSYYGPDLDVRYWTNEDDLRDDLQEVQRIWLIIRDGKDDGWTQDLIESEMGEPEIRKGFRDLVLYLFTKDV